MKKHFFKIKLFLISSVFISFYLFSAETLTKFNTSWATFLSGEVICEPEETTYGFCLVTDARTACGFSDKGVLLWEKPIGQSRNVTLTVLKDDFILIHEKNENILKLMNPSGTQLWKKELDFIPREKPLIGRDGRFFIYSDRLINCYNIDGIIKWSISTEEQKNLPAQELPDGTLIFFLSDQNGKTRGLRLSPFGEKLEEITFAGSINSCCSFDKGVLLNFTDGSSGLFSIDNNKSVNKWVVNNKNSNSKFIISKDKSDFRLLSFNSDSIFINQVSHQTGEIEKSIQINGFNTSNIQKIYFNESGLFICDTKKAALYDNEKEIWSALMPDSIQQDYNYLIYINQNYLIFCNKNWSMNAFRTSQKMYSNKSVKKTYKSLYIQEPVNKLSFQYDKHFDSYLTEEKRIESLKNGNFEDEKKLISEILFICDIYANDLVTENTGVRKESTIFEIDKSGFQNLLLQLTLICNDDSQKIAADIIKRSRKNDCKFLLKNLKGYDPDGELLDALEIKADCINHKDNASIKAVCDSVYEICRFMGRPAYNTKGKLIIKKFMDSTYDLEVRLYAREILKNILELKL